MQHVLLAPVLLLLATVAFAQHAGHAGMAMDGGGMVMHGNHDRLPRGCDSVSTDIGVTVHAGRDYAADRPGRIYGMSRHEVRVLPCSRVTVRFINEDEVRHQWMVHGLPKYLYPAGMFHIEVMGGRELSGTFIVPPDDRTYLIHCDLAQHMELGMRGQLVVGRGSGDLWGVPGVSDDFFRYSYLSAADKVGVVLVAASVFFVVLWWRRPPARP